MRTPCDTLSAPNSDPAVALSPPKDDQPVTLSAPKGDLLDELAAAGHLTAKGQAYVFGAVRNRAAGLSRPAVVPHAPGTASGHRGTVDPRRLAQAAALTRRSSGGQAA